MDEEKLKNLIQDIVKKSNDLKNKYTDQKEAPVNYTCIFSQSDEEYADLLEVANRIGRVIKQTPTGPLLRIEQVDTASGQLELLKIRQPDKTRPERGDADFTVMDYDNFKEKYISRENFKLIKRENFEMIELMDSSFDVRAYFSNPPLDRQLNIK
ncbi:MAG: hypothetical protein PHT51_00025 [Patescibacteria group bacterium]|nr:hypothetical protein [Patescibacteria group bacterium]MDD4610621.1 hypothetical protein [Patescibacteria group bacterium]